MRKIRGLKTTLVEAEMGKFLALVDRSANIGKPIRIIFDNSAVIPEFEELDITEDVPVVEPVVKEEEQPEIAEVIEQ